jgi:hypothetical protein
MWQEIPGKSSGNNPEKLDIISGDFLANSSQVVVNLPLEMSRKKDDFVGQKFLKIIFSHTKIPAGVNPKMILLSKIGQGSTL